MISVKFSKSDVKNKRLKAVFFNDGKKIKTVHFGYDGGSTFVDHKNETKKDAWIARHSVRGSFNIYDTSSSLARWVLWNKESITESITDYKRKFNLK